MPRFLTAAGLALLIAQAFVTGAPAQTDDAQRIYTRWDSIPELDIPVTRPIEVEADHITAREIIQRAMKGELTKLAGHTSVMYTWSLRSILEYKKKMQHIDRVYRTYEDVNGFSRTLFLDTITREYKRDGDDWVLQEDKTDVKVTVEVRTSTRSQFTDLPFFLEEDSEFEFKLADRTIEKDHVVFKIVFRPKSDFKPMPYGVIYISSDQYRIVHEEYFFEKNPFPLLIADIHRVSRHWAELPTGEWIMTRMMADLDLRSLPFGVVPKNVRMGAIFDEFTFDKTFDPVLFGEYEGEAPPVAVNSEGATMASGTVRTDTLAASGFLGQLQRNDTALYPTDVLAPDQDFRDRVVATHDSLGLERLMKEVHAKAGGFDFGLNFSNRLTTYNRVEELVAGAHGTVARGGRVGLDLSAHLAFATGPSKWRYYVDFGIPIELNRWMLTPRAGYADHVVPFGSNRPTLSGVRAFVGGADDQDYMQSEVGFAELVLRRGRGFVVGAGYAADTESSVRASTDFSLFGSMNEPNPPIDEGEDRRVYVNLTWQQSPRLGLTFAQLVSGGRLNGDFRYNRSDAELRYRHFIFGRHELVFEFKGVATGDAPPVQRLADIGGLTTVRGYDRRTLVGNSSFAARVEYMVPYDLLRHTKIPVVKSLELQLVPWADAGRVWEGNSDVWLHSVGFGLQRYMGPFGDASNFRVDFAFPTQTGRRGDVSVFVQFAAGLY